VDLRARAIAAQNASQEPLRGLDAAIAACEAREMREMLENAQIGQLRERLLALEARAAEGPAPASSARKSNRL